jgi:serine/threonine protein kinase
MGSMLHAHLVRLIGISLTDDGLAIVSQYCADGCLLDFLKKNHGKLSNTVVLQWAQQIAEASREYWVMP